MPQSLFLLASISILAIFGLNRQRALAADERAAINRSIEVAALDVNERWGDQVRDRAFDEADVGSEIARVQGEVGGLSRQLGREAGEAAADPATFDDVDDYHGLVIRDSSVVLGEPVLFDVSFTATYADTQAFGVVTSPTTAKVVTVVVEEVLSGPSERRPVRVEIPIRMTSAKQTLLR